MRRAILRVRSDAQGDVSSTVSADLPSPNRRSPWNYVWVAVLLAGVLTFAGGTWLRNYLNRPTALERLVAAGEPEEHVHAVAALPDGTTYVGTHTGVLVSRGGEKWERLPGLTGDVVALAARPDGSLYVGGPALGVTQFQGGVARQLLAGEVHALAVNPQDPKHLVAFLLKQGLRESRDGGATWASLGNLTEGDILSLAFHPTDAQQLVAGGLGSLFLVSADGGRSWAAPFNTQGTISGLAFETAAPHRLWAAMDGALAVSERPGASWRREQTAAKSRSVVSVSLAAGRDEPVVVTSGGFLFTSKQTAGSR